jgi:hypothetical protein
MRESPERGVYLEGASEHTVGSAPEVLSLVAFGRRRLHFAETKMNRHSSRSHAIAMVNVERLVRAAAHTSSSHHGDIFTARCTRCLFAGARRRQ